MKQAVRSSDQLLSELGLSVRDLPVSRQGEQQFPVFVPREYLDRMQPGDPQDPLLLQVLPRQQESETESDFVRDPVGDGSVEVVSGLLHKYQGRVLLILSGACAVHCRYCFRRHYPYHSAPKSLDQWRPALEYIASDDSIHEVIFSGGDPLSLADTQLESLVQQLDAIPHVSRLRIHTRFPIVIPQRIDDAFCDWFRLSRLSKWVVLHINHRREIDGRIKQSVERLRTCGATVLNQAVLLRDINDDLESLVALCEGLIEIGVVPYYLHQLDRVLGASHYETNWEMGLELVRQMTEILPGYAVPKYVQEIPGEPSKTHVHANLERL
jgi:EF-P beta-lysylation protein EpmB